MSLTALVLGIILLAGAMPIQDAFASNGEGPKQKHIDKHEEKHGDKHKDKKKDKKEAKKKIIKKIKEKIIPIIKEKLEKHKGKIIQKIKEKIAEYKEKKSKKASNHDDDDEKKRKGHENHDYDSDGKDDKKNGKGHEDETHENSNEEETEQTSDDENNEEVIIHVDETNQSKMNKFRGGGNDNAPTLGTDRYGNNYVDNGFTFNDFTTDVEGFTTHMPLQTLQVGELNTAVLKIYDNRGAGKIEHVELAFGLDYDEYASESENKIIWSQNFKGEQLVFENDPNNLLMDISVIGKADGKIMELTFNFAFREPMAKSKIALVVWDQDRHSRTVYFNDGIEVVGESLNPAEIITVLDEKGYPVKITVTGENEGIDEKGNIWTHNSPWTKQSTGEKLEIIEPVGGHGFDRSHSMFDSYKNSQAQTAQEKLIEILGGHNINNFSD